MCQEMQIVFSLSNTTGHENVAVISIVDMLS